ncbi:glutathione S-transferase T3-like protein [Tanacetum coccineum]
MAGANNDINVLDNSPLFDDLLDDLAPVVPYVVNGVQYRNGYCLADGIYLEWASFVKSFTVATDPKHTIDVCHWECGKLRKILWILAGVFMEIGVVRIYGIINVLDNSSLFDDLLDDLAPVVPYVVNGVQYRNGYYLADGIYPEWASLAIVLFGVLQGQLGSYSKYARDIRTSTLLRRIMYASSSAEYKRWQKFGVKVAENDVDYLKRASNVFLATRHRGVAFSLRSYWVRFLRLHPKWDAPEQVDLTGDVPGATQEDLFGHDARPRPAGKPRPAKKTKSDATASTGGSSASTQFRELMEQELRLKREAAERAFEAQAEKDSTLMRLE